MQKDTVTKTLRSLAEGDRSRSETARLRDVLPEIEAALGAGVKRSAILEALQGQGFTMTLKSFESALYRLRKAKPEHKAVKTQPQPAIKPEVSTPQPEETKPPQKLADDSELEGLSSKQRRERYANSFIPEDGMSPAILNRIKKAKQ